MIVGRFIRQRGRARRGQMMVVFALTLTVFMGALMLGVDLTRLRTAAENAQRAANAAALAGVVYLPDYQNDAFTRADEEAAKNSFVDGQNGVTVTPSMVPGYSTRLKVTITTPASLIFGQIFGLGPKTISRAATAEYDVPLQMGAPDYVLGYAPFPTSMITATGGVTPTQGFYLIARGPYGQQENGDAYSQYFESYSNTVSGGTLNPTGANTSLDTNPCQAPPTSTPSVDGCENLTANPDAARIGGFNGYDYVVDNPVTQTLIIKLFDPYDEGPYQHDAAPSDGSIIAPYSTRYPDQWSCGTHGVSFCSSTVTTATNSSYAPPVALQFTLSGPYQTVYDTSSKTITATPTISTGNPGGYTCTSDCVLSSPFVAGDDPTHMACYPSCAGKVSPYAYKFLNYAIIHNKGIYYIHVQSTVNSGWPFAGTYGVGGNIFGLAACAYTGTPTLGTSSDPSAGGLAVSDPYTSTGSTPGWNQSSCPNPNLTPTMQSAYPACANPGTAPTDECVHIYGVNRMAIYVNLSSGNSLIPLGYVPPEYDGKTLQVNLYDVGDSTGGNIQVLTPAADLSHTTGTNGGFPVALDYSYSAAPTDPNSGYVTVGQTTALSNTVIPVANNGTALFNGSWLKIKVPIALPGGLQYVDMVNTFGGYWKVLYSVTGGDDTTTWEISVNGAPVHLVAP